MWISRGQHTPELQAEMRELQYRYSLGLLTNEEIEEMKDSDLMDEDDGEDDWDEEDESDEWDDDWNDDDEWDDNDDEED